MYLFLFHLYFNCSHLSNLFRIFFLQTKNNLHYPFRDVKITAIFGQNILILALVTGGLVHKIVKANAREHSRAEFQVSHSIFCKTFSPLTYVKSSNKAYPIGFVVISSYHCHLFCMKFGEN